MAEQINNDYFTRNPHADFPADSALDQQRQVRKITPYHAWLNVSGDIDDFIFYDNDSSVSSR